jgi:hypothetical protein
MRFERGSLPHFKLEALKGLFPVISLTFLHRSRLISGITVFRMGLRVLDDHEKAPNESSMRAWTANK